MATEQELMDAGILITADTAEERSMLYWAKKEGRHCEKCGRGNGYHADDCAATIEERATIHLASGSVAPLTVDEQMEMIRQYRELCDAAEAFETLRTSL